MVDNSQEHARRIPASLWELSIHKSRATLFGGLYGSATLQSWWLRFAFTRFLNLWGRAIPCEAQFCFPAHHSIWNSSIWALIPFAITCHPDFLYFLFFIYYSLVFPTVWKPRDGWVAMATSYPSLLCFSTIFLHFNKITIYGVQSFIPLHCNSSREVSCLTRILMITKTWLSSEAARRPYRVIRFVFVFRIVCVQDQGLTCKREGSQLTGLQTHLWKIYHAGYI